MLPSLVLQDHPSSYIQDGQEGETPFARSRAQHRESGSGDSQEKGRKKRKKKKKSQDIGDDKSQASGEGSEAAQDQGREASGARDESDSRQRDSNEGSQPRAEEKSEGILGPLPDQVGVQKNAQHYGTRSLLQRQAFVHLAQLILKQILENLRILAHKWSHLKVCLAP